MGNSENKPDAFLCKCPKCGFQIYLKDQSSGIMKHCPSCGQPFIPEKDSGIKVARISSEINGMDIRMEKYYGNEILKDLDDIYSNDPEKSTVKRWLYILIGFFFGVFGFHDLYAKRYNHAILLFVISVAVCSVIEPLVLLIGAYVIYELFTVVKDGNGKPMQ